MKRLICMSVSLAALVAAPAMAQEQGAAASQQAETGASVYDEIVVTAQKREENVIDVPVSVSVIGQEQLSKQRIYSIADLARAAPALEMIQAFGGPGGGGQIRGIGTQSFTRSAEGAVGIVVDGVPQGNVPNNAIFDLARVEVLKGPQGTLFGLTSSAGVINMATVAPEPGEFSGYGHVDYSPTGDLDSEVGETTFRGAANVPFGESAALRVAVNYNRVEGVQRNAFNGEDNVLEDGAVRGRFLLQPNDTVTINLAADYDSRRQNYGDPQFVYVEVPAGSPLAGELAACGIVASYDNNSRCSNLPNHVRNKNYGFSGQIDVDLGGGTLTSITGWRRDEQLPSSVDIMGTPQEFTQIFFSSQINDGEQFTQELRYASNDDQAFEYTVGLFFSDFEGSSGYAPGGGFNVGTFQLAPFFINFVKDASSTATTSESYAAFGQGTYHVTDRLSFLGGVRYTHQEITDSQSTNPFDPASVATSGSLSESNVSGKVGVQYEFNNDLHTYATLTRGYKGPQIIPAAQGSASTLIEAEIPTAYEAGAKGAVFEGRLGYDLSLFYTEVENYQGQRCSINGVGVLLCRGESIPEISSKGFEITIFGEPLPHLNFNAGYVYNIAEFPDGWTGFNPNDLRNPVPGTTIGVTNLGGLQLVGSPRNKFIFNGEYAVPLGVTEIYFGGDAVYKSEMRLGYSGDDRFVYPSDWLLSLRGGLRDPDGRWSVELFARNIDRNREPATLFGGPAFVPPGVVPFIPNGTVDGVSGWATQASRRQVGVSLEVTF